MNVEPIAIRKTGLITSVGLSASSSCAAFRAKLSNPSETRFIDSSGDWIMAHQVALLQPWRGLSKLTKMAAMAIEEAMGNLDRTAWLRVPLLLCVAEESRPGRLEGLSDQLLIDVQTQLDAKFHAVSATVAHGRVGVAVALAKARSLIHKHGIERVLVAATDSLVSWPTLSHYEGESRLLTLNNSNGFMPGEGAGALLLTKPSGKPELVVRGLGFAFEKANITSDEPLRAEGLSRALNVALIDADALMHDMDYRITDLSGEQYYFKEAALALSRTLRQRKNEFEIWHPAECTGEVGAASGVSVVALANDACLNNYAKGPAALCHWSADAGQRAAVILHWQVT